MRIEVLQSLLHRCKLAVVRPDSLIEIKGLLRLQVFGRNPMLISNRLSPAALLTAMSQCILRHDLLPMFALPMPRSFAANRWREHSVPCRTWAAELLVIGLCGAIGMIP